MTWVTGEAPIKSQYRVKLDLRAQVKSEPKKPETGSTAKDKEPETQAEVSKNPDAQPEKLTSENSPLTLENTQASQTLTQSGQPDQSSSTDPTADPTQKNSPKVSKKDRTGQNKAKKRKLGADLKFHARKEGKLCPSFHDPRSPFYKICPGEECT